MVGVYGPRRPARQEGLRSDRALVRCTYNMAPFSVSDRKRPGRDRRSLEISKVLSEALTNAVLVERFPRTVIDVNVEVLEADAGTRCAALTAASVAESDPGNEAKWENIKEKLDMENLIDYLLANWYVGNNDWGDTSNWYATGYGDPDKSKWYFHSWDAEKCLNSITGDNQTDHHPGGEFC